MRKAAEAKAKLLHEKEKAEAMEKELILKKEKDTLKKALKKERKLLRTMCMGHDYFASDDHKIQIRNMSHLEHLCEVLSLSE